MPKNICRREVQRCALAESFRICHLHTLDTAWRPAPGSEQQARDVQNKPLIHAIGPVWVITSIAIVAPGSNIDATNLEKFPQCKAAPRPLLGKFDNFAIIFGGWTTYGANPAILGNV
jgi:hypothetical protein